MITFQSFLQSIRRQKRVDLDTLGMGICSPSFLSRVESGDRKAPYLLRECLMGRLGISGDSFYEFLQPKEYEAWRLRQEIVHNFLFDQSEEVKINIEKYGKLFSSDDVISKQFYLYVSAEAMVSEGSNIGDALNLYKEAAECSMGHLVRNFDGYFDAALLSIQEYCVLVKYISAEIAAADSAEKGRVKELLSKLVRIMDKIEKDNSDGDIAAKICSMAVAFYSKGVRKFFPDDSGYSFEEKDRCFKAVEFLRKSQKTYYLSEIMEALGTNSRLSESESRYLDELKEYLKVIESIYKANGLSMKACNTNSAYVLVESGAYAISDVLLRRRKMLRLSQKELCEGICAEKTMARMENGKCAVQDVIFRQLCERLKLVPDYVHGEIVYDDLYTYDLYNKVKDADNSKSIEELSNNLKKLKDNMNMEVLSNKQCWARAFNNLKRMRDEITDEEYCENILKLLSLTIGDLNRIDRECVCFTDAEKKLLHNFTLRHNKSKKEYLDLIVTELAGEAGDIKLLMHYGINAFLLSFYASELGNESLYSESDAVSNRILNTGLRINSLAYISDNIYNKYWNAKEIGSYDPKDLDQCLALSKFSYNKRDVDFYTSRKQV